MKKNSDEQIALQDKIVSMNRARNLKARDESEAAQKEFQAERRKDFDDTLEQVNDLDALESDKLLRKSDLIHAYMEFNKLTNDEIKDREKELAKLEVDIEKAKYAELKKMAEEFYGTEKNYWQEREAQLVNALKHVQRGSDMEKNLEQNLANARHEIIKRNLEEAERLQAGYNKSVSKGREFELNMAKSIYTESLKNASLSAKEKEAIQKRLDKVTEEMLLRQAGLENLKGKERKKALEDLQLEQERQAQVAAGPAMNIISKEDEIKHVYASIKDGSIMAGESIKKSMIEPLDEFIKRLLDFMGILKGGLGISPPPNGLPAGGQMFNINVNMNAGALAGAVFDSRNKGKDDAEKWGSEVANIIKEKLRTPTGGGIGTL